MATITKKEIVDRIAERTQDKVIQFSSTELLAFHVLAC